MRYVLTTLLLACACVSSVWGQSDARVRSVTYQAQGVVTVPVARGVVTRIVFSPAEKLKVVASGFSADCGRAEAEWCITGDPGSNQVVVKPRDGATQTNLEISTDKRDYSLLLRVVSGGHLAASRGAVRELGNDEPLYRVVFAYGDDPMAAVKSGTAAREAALRSAMELMEPAKVPAVDPKAQVAEKMRAWSADPRNSRYSLQVLKGSKDIEPSAIFDDGRFTYFEFREAREVPAVFAIDATGAESRVPFHMKDSLLVVQRTARRFVLRLGNAAVGVWNDGYDELGRGSPSGTTVSGVVRVLKQGANDE